MSYVGNWAQYLRGPSKNGPLKGVSLKTDSHPPWLRVIPVPSSLHFWPVQLAGQSHPSRERERHRRPPGQCVQDLAVVASRVGYRDLGRAPTASVTFFLLKYDIHASIIF